MASDIPDAIAAAQRDVEVAKEPDEIETGRDENGAWWRCPQDEAKARLAALGPLSVAPAVALARRAKLIEDCSDCPNCFTWTSSGSRRGRCDRHQSESGEVYALERKALQDWADAQQGGAEGA